MKRQNLFSWKNKTKYFIMSSTAIFTQHAKRQAIDSEFTYFTSHDYTLAIQSIFDSRYEAYNTKTNI